MPLADRLTAAYASLAPRLVVEARTNGVEIELSILQLERGNVVDVVGVGWSHNGHDDRLVAYATARAATRSPDATAQSFLDEPWFFRALALDSSLHTVADFAAVLGDPHRLAAAMQRLAVVDFLGLDAPELYPLTDAGRALLTPALFRQLVQAASAEQVAVSIEAWVDEDPFAGITPSGRALALASWELVGDRTPGDLRQRALAAIDRIPDDGRPPADLVRKLIVG
jgi:hypothetical protein